MERIRSGTAPPHIHPLRAPGCPRINANHPAPITGWGQKDKEGKIILIIYELANNHGGSVDLGKRIIDEFSAVAKQFPQFRHCFKMQYRDIAGGTYLHPTCDPNHKYVRRFKETNLSEKDRITLKEHAERAGFLTACTPFDEKSVRDVVKHGYNILKVGSPSFSDWGLWYEINKFWYGPIIASCGGATEAEIDRVVESNRGKDLTLMHCVSEYPTRVVSMQLNQVDWLRERYPRIPIGFSSHQTPTNDFIVAADWDVFEFHVCVEPRPNPYSILPNEAMLIIKELNHVCTVSGESNIRVPGPRPTQFMRRNIDGRMYWKPEDDVVEEVMALIKKSGVVVPKGAVLELSHHYGLGRFRQFGAAVITCFNHEYAKKLLVILPKQSHPTHYHLIKDETFTVLYGSLVVDGDETMSVGDTLKMAPKEWHSFYSELGCVFEEISTRHHPADSYYLDEEINQRKGEDRKTKVREF